MNDSTPPPEKPTLFSEAPGYVKFFFNPARPLALRVSIAAFVMIIFFYPLLALKSGSKHQGAATEAPPEKPKAVADSASEKPARVEKPKPKEIAEVSLEAESAADRTLAAQNAESTSSTEAEIAPKAEESGTPFHAIHDLFRMVTSIDQLSNGDVWVATMQELAEFKDGEPASMAKKLDSASFDRLFDRDLPPITAAATDGTNELWTGSGNGELMHYVNYDWKVVFEKGEPINDKISAIVRHQGDLYIGAKGLWKWNIESGKLSRIKGFNGISIRTFLLSPTLGLLVGASNGVWQLTDAGWQEFHGMSPEQGGVTVLHDDGERGILIGSANGLIRLSKAGVVAAHSLTGHSILSISGGPNGELWVGTGDSGLRYFDGESWFQASVAQGLPGAAINQVLRDKHDHLWMSLPGHGLYVAKAKEAISWIKANKDLDVGPDKDAPRSYKNACKAVEKELVKTKLSGGISTETIDGAQLVFFQGKQVCPSGLGYRRDDGKVAMLRDWTVTLYRDGERQEVTIPRTTPADQATAVFLDSRDRIWVGTKAGPSYSEEGKWFEFMGDPMLGNNAVQTIVEDANANIWLGTSPTYNKDTKEYEQPDLHRFNAQGWSHYGPANGLVSWIVSSLLPAKDGRLVIGTPNGLCFMEGEKISMGRLPKKLKQSPVTSLSEDDSGAIWTGHSYFYPGVSWYDGAELHYVAPTDAMVEPNFVSAVHDGEGEVWLLGTTGKVGVYPRSFFVKTEKAQKEAPPAPEKDGANSESKGIEKKSADDPAAATSEQKSLFGE